jgi:hypothetical protein
MQKIWRETAKFRDTAEDGNEDDESLREKVIKKCSFYYILEPVWSTPLPLSLKKVTATKHIPAEHAEATKPEEIRISIEKEKSRQAELELRCLKVRLRIEQATCERLRLETILGSNREKPSNNNISMSK